MALPLGPVILLTVVGAAIFGGLDVRKKKTIDDNTNKLPHQTTGVVPCAHVIDLNATATMVSIDNGPWVNIVDFGEPEELALQHQVPVVTFMLCDPDAQLLQLINDFCMQQAAIPFYGVYKYRIPEGIAHQAAAAAAACAGNRVLSFAVYAPMGGNIVRVYDPDDVTDLGYYLGGNAFTQVANTVIRAINGDALPGAHDVEVGG